MSTAFVKEDQSIKRWNKGQAMVLSEYGDWKLTNNAIPHSKKPYAANLAHKQSKKIKTSRISSASQPARQPVNDLHTYVAPKLLDV